MTDIPIWEDGSSTSWAPLGGVHSVDVCVIGLGGSGLSAIDEALGHGASVIGIDRGRVGSGAAGRNGGFLKTGLTSPLNSAIEAWGEAALPVYRSTIGEIERVFSQSGEAGHRVGSLRLATTPEEERDCQLHLAAIRTAGLPGEAYEGPEGKGILFPQDGAFNPLRRCRTLAHQVAAAGAVLAEESPAVTIESGRVMTPAGTVRAPLVVVAVDGRLETLFPELGVRTTRLQMMATEPDPGVTVPRPIYADFGYNYWQQLPDGRIAIGGARDRHAEVEWTHEGGVTSAVQADIETVLRNRVGSSAQITHRWSGHSAYTPDTIPVGRETSQGVWVVGAYNGVGNVLGAVYARAAVRAGLGLEPFTLPDTSA